MKLAIANEIRNQLGNATLFMLGAKNLVGAEDSLSFQIRGSNRFNHITITLNTNDLYDVRFSKIRGLQINSSKTIDNIYVDMLHDIIEQETGLATRMPVIINKATMKRI